MAQANVYGTVSGVCENHPMGTAYCDLKGARSMTIVLGRAGGQITTETGGRGQHGEMCSPIPLFFKGGPGLDLMTADDGCAETISCGGGFDAAEIDSKDHSSADCESRLKNGKPF